MIKPDGSVKPRKFNRKNAKYLGRIFKSEMGVSFCDYLLSLRLSKAEEMLRKTDAKIIDIALATGFNSISYFNREFFKKNGITPTDYRKRHKKRETAVKNSVSLKYLQTIRRGRISRGWRIWAQAKMTKR